MKSTLDFHADIDYAHGLRRPHWHLRLSLQTLETFLRSGEDAVGRNARVSGAEVRHRRTQQQLLSACRLQRPAARVTGRCSRLTPFPCATRPADTSCRAIRSHHSTM